MIKLINSLLYFSKKVNLIDERDYYYKRNKLFSFFGLIPTESEILTINYIYEILDLIVLKLIEENKLENDFLKIEQQKSIIMDLIIPSPKEVDDTFSQLYNSNVSEALDWFYNFSINSYDVKMDQIQKNKIYEMEKLIITINLSKPEKDPLQIAKIDNSNYPKCQLCFENEGFNSINKDPKINHRMVSLTMNDESWFFQYSPYAYFPHHCIVLTKEHRDMQMSYITFCNLFVLVDRFEGYFFGSNADLPISGGSILNHEHYQGGKFNFPIEKADYIYSFSHMDVNIEILDWYLNVVRLSSKNKINIIRLSRNIHDLWRIYKNSKIKGFDNKDIRHNSITPIARKIGDVYYLDLVLRNNQTSYKQPFGIYHPHNEIHHIKKENIGLIEVMGLAILPGRLLKELESIKEYINNGIESASVEKHLDWIEKYNLKELKGKNNIDELLINEVKNEFERGLSHCKVLSNNEFFEVVNMAIGI